MLNKHSNSNSVIRTRSLVPGNWPWKTPKARFLTFLASDFPGQATRNRSCKKLRVQKMLFWKRIWLDTPPGTDHVKSCVFNKLCFGKGSGWTRHREQIL